MTSGVSRAYTQSPDRPNYTDRCAIQQANVNAWFNASCFSLQAQGTFGSLGRDVAVGPGLLTTDLALLKDTRIRESMNLQFRAEFFNIFNRANFGLAVSTAFSGTGTPNSQFGKITSIVGTPRQVQLALKLVF